MKIKRLCLLLLLNASCTGNIFDEIADKDTDEAIYFQAKMDINDRDYASAIALLESLDPSYLEERERIPVYASAYSGRCGLEFLTLLQNMQGATGTVLNSLMTGFPGALSANADDCIQAESILQSIGDESARDGNENLLMAFNGLAKIGTILSSLADQDADGSPDAGFDHCDTTDLPDARVRHVGSGFAVVLLSLQAIGTDYIGDTLSGVEDICNMDSNLAAFCQSTDPDSFSAAEVLALRFAIASSDIGINSCGGNDFANCALAGCP